MTEFFKNLSKPYFVAEIGVNHNGDVDLAKKMIDAAKRCGADAVKFQSFTADGLACRSALSAPHVDESLGVDGTVYNLLEKLSLSREDQSDLLRYCVDQGIPFASTPFSFEEIDFLAALEVPFLKISSTDLTHLEFLHHAAKTGKPILLSTGMGTLAEVEAAVETILDTGNTDLAVLHCVSLYPPQPKEMNLLAIATLRQRFPNIPIGFSDHSLGAWAAPAAVALGAVIVEKHFTLDKTLPGPDQAVSADPEEMARLIDACRNVYNALGNGEKIPSEREASMRAPFLRSIVAKGTIPAGTMIQWKHLDFKRPGTGIAPNDIHRVLGRRALVDIPADTPVNFSMLSAEAVTAVSP